MDAYIVMAKVREQAASIKNIPDVLNNEIKSNSYSIFCQEVKQDARPIPLSGATGYGLQGIVIA
jgi:hypothetical protein